MTNRKRKKKSLILPSKKILRPQSAFESRMGSLPFYGFPPEDSPEGQALQKQMDEDEEFQKLLLEKGRDLSNLVHARMHGGSGLRMSNLLRSYFIEFCNRKRKYGPDSMPMSFSVVESFMMFDRERLIFDLRQEIEHLVIMEDYFNWLNDPSFAFEPADLLRILRHGKIYSYEVPASKSGFRIGGESQKVIAGISLVRNRDELSCLMLAGENPPFFPDGAHLDDYGSRIVSPGREEIVPDDTLSVEDRYLDGFPGFAKTIVMTRVNLAAGTHDVRYVCLDEGPMFSVLTDDRSAVQGSFLDDEEFPARAKEQLARYGDLFSSLLSLIFLPMFFAAEPKKVAAFDVSTSLGARADEEEFKETIENLEKECVRSRSIRCLPSSKHPVCPDEIQINPPQTEFKSDGYWLAIGPNEIGSNKTGNPIYGRSWVPKSGIGSLPNPHPFSLIRNTSDRPSNSVTLDNECKERALVGEAIATVALAGHIGRELSVSDHGIDMEIEFKNADTGEATGRKLYLQLKSGDSYLRKRKADGVEIFQIQKQRHVNYWLAQRFPVILIIRDSRGRKRWMEIKEWLQKKTKSSNAPVTQIEFSGMPFDVEAVVEWERRQWNS